MDQGFPAWTGHGPPTPCTPRVLAPQRDWQLLPSCSAMAPGKASCHLRATTASVRGPVWPEVDARGQGSEAPRRCGPVCPAYPASPPWMRVLAGGGGRGGEDLPPAHPAPSLLQTRLGAASPPCLSPVRSSVPPGVGPRLTPQAQGLSLKRMSSSCTRGPAHVHLLRSRPTVGGRGGSDEKSLSAPFGGIPRLQEPDLETTGLAGFLGGAAVFALLSPEEISTRWAFPDAEEARGSCAPLHRSFPGGDSSCVFVVCVLSL